MVFCGRQRTRPPLSLRRGPVFKTGRRSDAAALSSFFAAQAGFEPATLGLTSHRSTVELPSLFPCAEDKGLEPSPQFSSRSALAVQCSKPISAYPPGVRGEERGVRPSHLTSHSSPLTSCLRASSRTRTSTFSLEDCNATVTPYSPFNAGGSFSPLPRRGAGGEATPAPSRTLGGIRTHTVSVLSGTPPAGWATWAWLM